MKPLATIILGITLLTAASAAQAADRGYSSSLGSYRSSYGWPGKFFSVN